MIVFFADYPLGENLRDGMAQRIKAIDTEFENEDRIYLKLSYKIKYSELKISDSITIIKANILVNTKTICDILSRASQIYIHSVINGIYLPIFASCCKSITLDLHGVVPEEQKFNGRLYRYNIFSIVEKKLFKKIKNAVTVTNSMKSYYESKYPNSRSINYIVKPIFPKNSVNIDDIDNQISIKNKYHIADKDTVFIYTGGTQKWQNIDLMVQCMELMNNKNYVFFIMTRNIAEVYSKVEHLINRGYRIVVDSVEPSNLKSYYEVAHYGFMLRDDIIVNRVAAPTKMIEYLGYGLIPIVKCPEIGDWKEMGYEYIHYEDDLNSLSPNKSNKNAHIADMNIKYSEDRNLYSILGKNNN